jgi:hypothetical protein
LVPIQREVANKYNTWYYRSTVRTRDIRAQAGTTPKSTKGWETAHLNPAAVRCRLNGTGLTTRLIRMVRSIHRPIYESTAHEPRSSKEQLSSSFHAMAAELQVQEHVTVSTAVLQTQLETSTGREQDMSYSNNDAYYILNDGRCTIQVQ